MPDKRVDVQALFNVQDRTSVITGGVLPVVYGQGGVIK
jgi:hypothetical protein